FLSYDPGIYHNANARKIEPLPEPEKPRALPANVDLSERQRIATELLGRIDWQSETSGLAVCPGKHLHTTDDGERDCAVDLDNVPTAHCFRNSCRGILDGVNKELRSRIGKVECNGNGRESKGTNTGSGMPLEAPRSALECAKGSPDSEAFARLAALPLPEYDRKRKEEAKRLGIRPATLDAQVAARRPRTDTGVQGSAVEFPDVDPWETPVKGAQVL